MDDTVVFQNCNNSKIREIWQMWDIFPVPSKHKSRTPEFCRCLVLSGVTAAESWCCQTDIPSTDHWPFRHFKPIGFENGPPKRAAPPSIYQGLGLYRFHPHGFSEAGVLAAPSQASCILIQCQETLTCAPACTKSPLLPSFARGGICKVELIQQLHLTDTMERRKGSVIKDTDCALVRQVIEESL